MSPQTRPGKTVRVTGWILLIAVVLIARPILRRFVGPVSVHNSPMWWSIILWCAFTLYWSAAAKNSSAARKSESSGSRQWHVFLVNLALLLIVVPVPGMRQRFLPVSTILVGAGLAVQIAAGLPGVWARRHLGANWSGEITIKVDHLLIRTGPYARLRHPIYTAMLGMFAGSALVSGESHALVGLVLGTLAYWRKIRLEEANLKEAFGPAYSDYRSQTWALIPGVF